jgi:NADP-reducing hydrogenase subunit HndD
MDSIKVILNGKEQIGPEGFTILDLCKREAIKVPTLCYHPDICADGNCRICLVEVKGAPTLQAACSTPISNGMEIITSSHKIRKNRKNVLELILANHYTDCTECTRNSSCELQTLAEEYNIKDIKWSTKRERTHIPDLSSPVFERDNDKCILCGRCVEVCDKLQNVSAIASLNKGDKTIIGSSFEKPISEIVCINCGQCVAHCPTAALVEKSDIENIWAAIEDPQKTVVIQTAPAIRAALGELFEYPVGTRVTGKMVTALRQLGFDSVFDTQFTADLTIVEEGYELLGRLKKTITTKEPVVLPMTTSCSPGWVKYQEHFFPNLTENLSTCKSPQQMLGALLKTYWAEKTGVNPESIVSVSVMPCTAKKFEATRDELNDSGFQDVDYVLTTRELGKMIKESSLNFRDMEDGEFDHPLGESTGAGTIFGASGGVMEAAIRTAYEVATGREVPFKNLEITPIRGMEMIREASLKIENPLPEWNFLDGVELKVAVAYGTANAHKIMEKVERGESDYHFIEIMTCPGGCLGGGGQPLPTTPEIRKARAKAIYEEDRNLQFRKSHENPSVAKLYKEFLGEPNSPKAHKLLHTNYIKRGRY